MGKAVEEAEVVIRRGIPIPASKSQSNGRLYALARKMEVGDCIDLPYTRTGVAGNLGRALGYEFTQRKVGDILRVWRTA